MTRANNVEHVNIMFDDKTVDVGVGKDKTWACTPVSQQAVLDIIVGDVAFDKDIVLEEDHGGGDIVGCATKVADVIELLF